MRITAVTCVKNEGPFLLEWIAFDRVIGIERFEDRPVIQHFTRSYNPDIWVGESAIEVKSLDQNDFPLQHYGAHRRFFRTSLPKTERPKWTDASGRPAQQNLSIQRKLARLKGGTKLAKLHHAGFDRHKAKAAEPRRNPEFQELYEKALRIKLTGTQSAAYALALDMAS